jgi:hypothetical protein
MVMSGVDNSMYALSGKGIVNIGAGDLFSRKRNDEGVSESDTPGLARGERRCRGTNFPAELEAGEAW